MKIEVYFTGNSMGVDTYEKPYLSWVFTDGHLNILEGKDENDTLLMLATYPEHRVVKVRVV